ncbi:DUF6220 domain-containing protein [Micromonospora sp. NPDC048999]|uniref:DUF6220 domain-containing protein n=1 Tax=Micromonospora sp. NPDC048999 TaxID=3155391 RepID=UPI0033CAFAE4
MRKLFAGLAALLMLVVLAQFYFAASGAFSTASNDESFRPHRALGYVIFLLPVLMTIVAALARTPGRLIGMAALVAGLTAVQVVIAVFAKAFNDTGDTSTRAGQLVFGLHAINGLAIFSVAGNIARKARAQSRTTATDRQAGAGNDVGVSETAQPAS